MPNACLAACLALILSLNPFLGLKPALAQFESGSQASLSSDSGEVVFALESTDRDAQLGVRPAAPAVIRLGPPAGIDPADLIVSLLFFGLLVGGGTLAGWAIGTNLGNNNKSGENYAWSGAIIGGLTGALLLWIIASWNIELDSGE